MKAVAVILALLAVVAHAFVPSPPASGSSVRGSLRQSLSPSRLQAEGPPGGLVGSDIEAPNFDPWKLAAGDLEPETLSWYRAAELKHGRICMLAALGLTTQEVVQLPDPSGVFSETKGIPALVKVANERPGAIIQLLLAIGAIEVAALNRADSAAPGDLGFDPLNLQQKLGLASNPEAFEKMQLRELKNGRLAMVATAGMLIQQFLTGQATLEQLLSGHISPFGDGQGVF
ncbi:unnamed protein product [Vitrella brassicaformis CCMP3155]|uniref:Uncharacterized protein n=1 Tax=Vitrella brassicaformis (strain CCMP3155) TaxID=1169540 RepID=A0A0G4ESK4_VITBC|nr:unnamed protein product [Vitrella brassicaformis CCMP3155]|mmetsp:Transcript_53353/g.134342  ORF Transcript_53353/g.134342 Transcript_53353/m.134342 type:complete len:230 (-) Transcript_53353:1298-1987(-)|eukprot:CEM00977.1 unnamed protein product [Vitrella brassicaformis CCMP3155]